MAQALRKVNVSKAEKNPQKWLNFSRIQVFGEIQFSRKSLTNRRSHCAIIFCCYYKPPCSVPHETGKRLRRATTGAHLTKMKAQYQTFQTRYSFRAEQLVFCVPFMNPKFVSVTGTRRWRELALNVTRRV